jgi:hypothetical protein
MIADTLDDLCRFPLKPGPGYGSQADTAGCGRRCRWFLILASLLRGM